MKIELSKDQIETILDALETTYLDNAEYIKSGNMHSDNEGDLTAIQYHETLGTTLQLLADHIRTESTPDDDATRDRAFTIIEEARNTICNDDLEIDYAYNMERPSTLISESPDPDTNGAFVQAWAWVDFSNTILDKNPN